MRSLLIAIALMVSSATPVAASDNAEVIAVIHRWTDAFSQRSFNTDIAPCAEDAVITLGEIRHLDVDGGFAYLVAPVTLIAGVAWADQ